MKIAVMSDVHSYPYAVKKAYKDAEEQGCTKFVCLGDVVGYGPDPSGAVKWVKKHFDDCVTGNHDAGLVGRLSIFWFSTTARNAVLKHRTMVDEDDRKWLSSLEYKKIPDYTGGIKAVFAHGSATSFDPFDYIDSAWVADQEFKSMEPHDGSDGFDVEFVGHTHRAVVYSRGKNAKGFMVATIDPCSDNPKLKFKISPRSRYIINVGSVGYPRCQYKSIYCIFDTNEKTVEYRILPFDFNRYEKELVKAGIEVPFWLEMIRSKE